MKNIEKKLNKIYAITIATLFIAIAISSVFAVRTITDTGDSFDTFIRNSKGNYWTATGANLRLALFDLNSTLGGTVWLPAKTITITSDIRMTNHTTLQGAGMNATTLKLGTASTTTRVIDCDTLDNFTICDLSIDGNNGVVTDNYQAIYIWNSKYFDLYNLHIFNMYRADIYIEGTSGTYASSSYGHLHHIYIDGLRQVSAALNYQAIEIYYGAYITLDNIVVTGDGTSQNTWAIDFVGTMWCTLNNIIIRKVGLGMKFAGTSSANENRNITVSNLVITSTVNTTSDCCLWLQYIENSSFNNIVLKSSHSGIIIAGGGQTLKLNNVMIFGGADDGILNSGDFCEFSNIHAKNSANHGIYNSGANDNCFTNIKIEYRWNDALTFSSCNRFVFSNSEIIGNTNFGMYIKTSYNFSISSCVIKDNTGDGIDLVDATACNNFTISNCVLGGNAKAIDVASTSNYFVINGCVCNIGDGIDVNAAVSNTRRVNDTICVLTVS